MEYFPAPLEALVEQFARLPGIGGKTAQRLAFHVLSLPEEDAQAFADAIVTAKRTVTYCPVCRGAVPYLFLAQAGRFRDLRGGGPTGRGGHGAGPGVQRQIPCAPRRHQSHEPRRSR